MEHRFTKDFNLKKLTHSDTASKERFDEQYYPSDAVCDNLEVLSIKLLQPLQDCLKRPLTVTSGYRCYRLNNHIGGSLKSQHMTGQAADLQYHNEIGGLDNMAIMDAVKENKLEFDQMIWEQGGKWVHLSYNPTKNRNQILSL